MSKIIKALTEDAGFSVKFPEGVDGEPDFVITGLSIDCGGGDAFYSSMEACANYILDHIDELKSRKQYDFNVCDFTDENGVANCTIKNGEITKE